eukprot:GFUD01013840.1.p1 GENE.GFUD01013840.1~~GFUD01013840.1.p1  ORF type:complete len:346 (+),score=69.99 GFUD01013840.1:310-1347(+)
MSHPDYFPPLEKLLEQTRTLELILKDVKMGVFKRNEAEDFAGHLHPYVKGSFLRYGDDYDERAMKVILSDWFKECGHNLTKEETIQTLLIALRKASKKALACDIEKEYKLASEIEKNKGDPDIHIDISESNSAEQLMEKDRCFNQDSHNSNMKTRMQKILEVYWLVFLCVNILCLIICVIIGRYTIPFCVDKETSLSERSLQFNQGKLHEFHNECLRKQSTIPNLPVNIRSSVGIYTRGLGILVCGGTDDQDYNPKLCHTHKLNTDTWEKFPYPLNTNRIDSYIKISENKIYIIGGVSSEYSSNCYRSQEVLDLDKLSDGWVEQEVEDERNLCFKSELIINIPCD